MNIKSFIILLIITLFFSPFNSFSQDYTQDSLAVRAILDSNGLYDYPVELFTDSSEGRIVSIELKNRELTSLPSEIGNLTSLKNLNLEMNNLTSIPSEIGNLTSLKNFTLELNNLTSLPSEIGNLTSLKKLILTMNSLTSIPSEIGNLISLDTLFLLFNNLTSIPPQIGNLTNLIRLRLDNNKLSSLPQEIGNLTNLTELHLGSNNLAVIPNEIGSLNNLLLLDLEENNLTSLPSEIGNLINLLCLVLSFNNLTILPDSIVKLTPTFYCDLGYNKLDTNNLSDTVIVWLDTYDPYWRETQNVPIIYNPNIDPLEFSINLKKSSILFNLKTSGKTKLQIYNMKGRLLSTLVDSYKSADNYKVNWDSKRFGSGVYYLKLSTGNNALIQKAIVIK